MRRFTLLLLLAVAGCAPRSIIRHDAGAFAVRDYLKTAYETLASAETDGDGHRIRAQLETRALQDFTLYAAHPMSTCRMGRDPTTSVVRPDGRTHALEGLYIADSSIFPTSLGVNPSITTMALATSIGRGMVA